MWRVTAVFTQADATCLGRRWRKKPALFYLGLGFGNVWIFIVVCTLSELSNTVLWIVGLYLALEARYQTKDPQDRKMKSLSQLIFPNDDEITEIQ